MLYFDTHNGLGNQLFTYAFARSVAERFNLRLQHNAHEPCSKVSSGLRYVLPRHFDLDLNQSGRVLQGRGTIYATRHTCPIESIDGTRPVYLQGLYERVDQIAPYKEKIRGWLRFKKPLDNFFPPDKGLAAHVRLGDLRMYPKHSGAILNKSFWDKAISFFQCDTISWFTDSPNDPLMREMINEFGGEIVSGGYLEDFQKMMRFKYIITNTSTFSFWAAWLSDAKRIVSIAKGSSLYGGTWALFEKSPINREVDYWPDEERYMFI